MSEALKPCPFCGGKASIWTTEAYSCDSAERVLGCSRCDIYQPFANVYQSEIPEKGFAETWNTRAPATDEQAFANEKVKTLMEDIRIIASNPFLKHETRQSLRAALEAIALPSIAAMEADDD